MADKKWGGARNGAGRPKSEAPKRTLVVRVDEGLLPIIKKLKAGELIDDLLPVTENQDIKIRGKSEYQTDFFEPEENQEANIKLVLKYDEEHKKVVKLEGELRVMGLRVRKLESKYEALQHKEHDCMAIKADGTRCTREGKFPVKNKGVEVMVCLQHKKQFEVKNDNNT